MKKATKKGWDQLVVAGPARRLVGTDLRKMAHVGALVAEAPLRSTGTGN